MNSLSNKFKCFYQVDGIQGIMNAYNGALFNVSFAGPTLFGPVINAAATIASESLAQNARRYYVLLIITVSLCSFSMLKKKTMETEVLCFFFFVL